MPFIKTENFTNENGVEMVREIYDTMVIEKPANEPEPVEPEPTPDPVMKKLDSIEAKIQTNEELQTFYDDIVKEVGL